MTTAPPLEHFLVDHETVLARLDAIDPEAYAAERNHLDGAVTWLSPFLTHGVIDTTAVARRVLARHDRHACHKLLFELGWREYFHRLWERHGDAIFEDLMHEQQGVASPLPPAALLRADTGITVIDDCLAHLYEHGTLHNHARLWVAGIACNIARSRWRPCARWLHHHLIDGDLASNTLNWQWAAGTASSRPYLANQDNINRFGAGGKQRDTWLDVPYEAFDEDFPVPECLRERDEPELPSAPLPGRRVRDLERSHEAPIALHSLWNLDPTWRRDIECHVLFIDIELDARWPYSPKRWQLVEHWAERCKASVHLGTAAELGEAIGDRAVHRREYPACHGWPGEVEARRWLFPEPEGDIPSFSKYWKQVRGALGL